MLISYRQTAQSDSPRRSLRKVKHSILDRHFQGLWRNGNFLKLWAGETISEFGTQISFVAIPLLAVLTFEASPSQMGLLAASSELPALTLALFIGVWVDRLRRRAVMMVANIGRAFLLFLIPLAVWSGMLNIWFLYVVSFLAGTLTVFFAVGYQSYRADHRAPRSTGRGQ